jgi:hypothetical protein
VFILKKNLLNLLKKQQAHFNQTSVKGIYVCTNKGPSPFAEIGRETQKSFQEP